MSQHGDNLDGYLSDNCWFPADDVGLDWTRQAAAFNLGRHCLLRPNMELNLNSYSA